MALTMPTAVPMEDQDLIAARMEAMDHTVVRMALVILIAVLIMEEVSDEMFVNDQ